MAAEMILYYQGILRNLCKMNQRLVAHIPIYLKDLLLILS